MFSTPCGFLFHFQRAHPFPQEVGAPGVRKGISLSAESAAVLFSPSCTSPHVEGMVRTLNEVEKKKTPLIWFWAMMQEIDFPPMLTCFHRRSPIFLLHLLVFFFARCAGTGLCFFFVHRAGPSFPQETPSDCPPLRRAMCLGGPQ